LKIQRKPARSFPHKVVPLLINPNYANILRVIGQALEMLEVAEYDLRIDGNNWLVNAYFMPGKLKSLIRNSKWASGASRYRTDPQFKETNLDLRFTAGQISQLARELTGRRGIPNFHSDIFGTAELLRVVGHYIDIQKFCLHGIFRRDQFLTMRFVTARGEQKQEFFQTAYFYRLFVKMYVNRGDRMSASKLQRPEL
jgi:hypothetical protein